MKKITRLFGLGFLSVAALGSFTSCEKTGFKVGLLCLHGQTSTYDNNFIQAFKEACEDARKDLGLEKLDYDIKTDVAEDYNRIYTAAKEWAEDGYSLVCADSFGHQYGMIDVAKEYPNTEFCHATGTIWKVNQDVPNFHNAFASIYEGRYLTGVVAGLKLLKEYPNYSGDMNIGYVGAFPYAEVISGYTSFYLGCRNTLKKHNSAINLKMKVRYTSSWYNYKAEREAAEALIRQDKCKLISQHADSMGAPIACKNEGIPNVCYNISTKSSCPDTYLIASKINWREYYRKAIKYAYLKHNKKQIESKDKLALDECGSINSHKGLKMVELCEYGNELNNNQDWKNELDTVKTSLENGTLKVFDCDTFTVTINDKRNKFADVTFASPEETAAKSGKIKGYRANVIDDENYTPDTEVCFHKSESKYFIGESYIPDSGDIVRSAPYFELIIDGIDPLN